MKILIFNWRDIKNPEAGGAEVFTHEDAKRWVGKGHEVTLFASEFDGCKKEEVVDGIRTIRAGRKFSVYSQARKHYRSRFSKEGFDAVIDEINTVPFFTPKFVDKGEKIVPLIHQLAREYWFYEMFFPLNHLGYHFFEDRWLKGYARFPTVTVSESTKKDLLALGFKKVFIVSEGLNFKPLEHICEKESKPIVVYAGRLKKAKRPDHAIKAFKFVKEKLPDAELWIIGDGYFRNELERMSFSGIRFFGRLDNNARRALIGKAWVLVNPSPREGYGLNVIEANALGTCCIGYDVPGLRDSIIKDRTGLLVEAGNIVGLGDAIVKVLKDDDLRMKMSSCGLEYSRTITWDRSAEEFEKILKET